MIQHAAVHNVFVIKIFLVYLIKSFINNKRAIFNNNKKPAEAGFLAKSKINYIDLICATKFAL